MATYNCIQAQLLDNVGVVRTLTNTPVEVGNSVTFSSLPAPFTALNGTFTVTALPNYLFIGVDEYGDYLYDWDIPILNQIAFAVTGTDAVRQAVATGTIHGRNRIGRHTAVGNRLRHPHRMGARHHDQGCCPRRDSER